MAVIERYEFSGDGLEDALFQLTLGRALLAAVDVGKQPSTEWIADWLGAHARPKETEAFVNRIRLGRSRDAGEQQPDSTEEG